MKRTMMAACILSLVACGGSKDDVATDQQRDWESQRQSLVYSFPDQGQLEVPVPSPVVLRFSSPVAETAPAIELREVGGAVVSDVALEWVDGKRGLIITPQNKLKPLTDYVVDVPAIELEKGEASARSIQFTTRGLHEGPRSLVARDTFEVVRTIPDGVNFAVTDFASFRLQFSQPLDPSTVKYGDAGDSTVQLMGPEGLVDAHLLVSGPYITIDPKEDLTPGGDYRLNITGGLTSVYGDNLTGGSLSNPMPYTLTATPVDTTSPTTGERVSMVQDIADTGEISPLTGKPINLVPMASVLLGEETATQASGTLAAELAFVPNFPDQTPLRIKRGSLIEGASIDVLIGGEVPAGFESGKVRMDFLSDATGYLLPNDYSNADDAPRQVRLWMDVAVSTETPAANGAITQDLLHIELVGTSIVEDGQMVINAVGVVEPDVLGSERATGVLSFYMKAYEDQDNPPVVADNTPLEIQSWSPEANVANFRTTDPLIIQFNKPLGVSEQNAANYFQLEENGQLLTDVEISFRGAAVYMKPKGGFKRSVQSAIDITNVDSYVYRAVVKPGVWDLSGNNTKQGESHFEFELPVNVTKADHYSVTPDYINFIASTEVYEGEIDVSVRSPMITALYPGFPCAIETSSLNLNQGVTGRCKGGLSEVYQRVEIRSTDKTYLDNIPDKLPEDLLPLPELPANRPIIAIFTKNIDPRSLKLGGSFRVSEVDEYGNEIGPQIDGLLTVDGKKITFHPTQEWEAGKYYAYTLGSNGDRHAPAANCDGTESICSEEGLPIQTQLHELTLKRISQQDSGSSIVFQDMDLVYQDANATNGGGDPLVQYFVAGERSEDVLQILHGPSSDTNANMVHERNTLRNVPDTRLMLSNNYNRYTVEEKGAEGQPLDPHSGDACQSQEALAAGVTCLDREGVTAPPNSAKLLGAEADLSVVFSGNVTMPVVSTGCGFKWLMDDPTGMEGFVKEVCPEDRFTYLASDLVTEVGSFNEDLGGVEVKIWPGQIMSTSVPLYTTLMVCGFCELGLDSGPQVMRMRYAKNDESCEEDVMTGATCLRDKPITAVIKDVGGQPRISTTVDVYIDAIDLQDRVQEISFVATNMTPGSEGKHDVVAVPVTLQLEGDVTFNDDGTMQVGMMNTNEVVFGFETHAYNEGPVVTYPMVIPLGRNHLIIPKFGSNVSYISEIVK